MNKPLPAGILEAAADRYSTHRVLNQALPASAFNAFAGDEVLRAGIEREAPWAADRCAALGAVAGDEQVQELARLANRYTPELKTHDRFGNRIDWVEFHPSWHELMSLAWKHEVPNLRLARERDGRPLSPAPCCPTCGTRSSTGPRAPRAWPTRRMRASRPSLRWRSGPRRARARATSSAAARSADKPSVVIGYAMTEKQGRLGPARDPDHRPLLASE
jgi:putative acyl-CoA dehydrogenase